MATGDAVDAFSDDELVRLINETCDRQEPSGPGIARCVPLTEGYMVKLYRDGSHLEVVQV